MLVPITLFIVIGVIIVVPQILKSRDRQRMYEVMRVAYERGQTPTPEMLDLSRQPGAAPTGEFVLPPLPEPPSTPYQRDLRRGVTWTAVGLGLLIVGLVGYGVHYNDGWALDWIGTWGSLAAIPLCVGLAFLALWFFAKPKFTAAPRA